jgi:hypothetical protein
LQNESTRIKVPPILIYQTKLKSLKPFVGNPQKYMPDGIPFELKEYIDVEFRGYLTAL